MLQEWFLWLFYMPQAIGTTAVLLVIYLNLGWRFAEYKLRINPQWRAHSPMLLHLLWPSSAYSLEACIPNLNHEVDLIGGDSYYKFYTMILFLPGLLLNGFIVLSLWSAWAVTWGRVKPINPAIAKQCYRPLHDRPKNVHIL